MFDLKSFIIKEIIITNGWGFGLLIITIGLMSLLGASIISVCYDKRYDQDLYFSWPWTFGYLMAGMTIVIISTYLSRNKTYSKKDY
jgi:hypothetical protein